MTPTADQSPDPGARDMAPHGASAPEPEAEPTQEGEATPTRQPEAAPTQEGEAAATPQGGPTVNDVPGGAGTVTVRYWAAARQAAGTAQESHPTGTLADVLTAARLGRDDRFARVLAISSYLVDESQVGARSHDEVVLSGGAVVDVLPPFAGG